MILERVEGNQAIYSENGRRITVIRESLENAEINFLAVLEEMIKIIEQEDNKGLLNKTDGNNEI